MNQSQHQDFRNGMRNQRYPWQQEPGSYPFMLNGALENDEKIGYGLSFEESTIPLHEFGPNYKLRGWKNLVDKDAFLLFLYNEKTRVAEIGIFHKKRNRYVKCFDDSALHDENGQKRSLCFNRIKKIPIVTFHKNPCNHLHVIWSSGSTYYVLDLDAPTKKLKYEDILLFVNPCKGATQLSVIEKGGRDLPNGAYYVAVRFNDGENNATNFLPVDGPVYLGSEDNAPGERSEDAIRIAIKDVHAKIFDRLEICIISINANTRRYALLPPIYLHKSDIVYYHRGTSEYVRDLTHDEVMILEERDIQGEKVAMVNNWLVLYQTYGDKNPNLQPFADKLKVSWVAYLCPAAEAYRYKTMCHNEVYSLYLGENYEDGMRSRAFHIRGRDANPYDKELIVPEKGSPATCQEQATINFEVNSCLKGNFKGNYNVWITHPTQVITRMVGRIIALGRGGSYQRNYTFTTGTSSFSQPLDLSGLTNCDYVSYQLILDVVETSGGCLFKGISKNLFVQYEKNTPCAPDPGGRTEGCMEVLSFNSTAINKKDAIPGDRNGNCSDCPQPRWKVENTATVEKWYCYDPWEKSKGSFKQPAYVPLCNNGTLEPQGAQVGGNTNSNLGSATAAATAANKSCSSCGGGSGAGGAIGKCNDFEGREIPCNPKESGGCVSGKCGDQLDGTQENQSPTPPPDKKCKKWMTSENSCVIPRYDSDGTPNDMGDAIDKITTCLECHPDLLDKFMTMSWTTDTELNIRRLEIIHRNGKVVDLTKTAIQTRYFATYEAEPSTPDSEDQLNLRQHNASVPQTQSATLEPNCKPIEIRDESGCYILGYDLPVFAEGTMGYWESEEVYPSFSLCDGLPLYGGYAGRPIQHHLMPPEDLIPHMISFQNGVPHRFDPANDEFHDSYVILLGIKITGLEKNLNPVKPKCKERPWSILYEERNDNNSRVIDKGLMMHMFRAEYFGQMYAYPRNAVNALEQFDHRIAWRDDPNKTVRFRGGVNMDKPMFMFYGTNTRYNKPPVDVHQLYVNMNVYGSGWRYGINAEDPHIEKSFFYRPRNQKGCRQGVHLNHYERIKNKDLVTPGQCVKTLDVAIKGYYCTRINNTKTTQDLTDTIHNGVLTLDINLTNVLAADVSSVQYTITYGNNKTITKSVRNAVSFTESMTGVVNGPLPVKVQLQVILKEGSNNCTYAVEQSAIFDYYELPFWASDAEIAVRRQKCQQEWRYALTSSSFVPPVYSEKYNAPMFCVKSASYVKPDSVFKDLDNFSYPVMNKAREGGIVIELKPEQPEVRLSQFIDPYLSDDKYNGYFRKPELLGANQTADGSFFGDGYIHEYPIFLASCFYVTLLRYLPKQYGALNGNKCIELFPIYEKDEMCGTAQRICGDEFVGYHSIKRTSYVSDHHGEDNSPGGFWQDKFGVPDCGKFLAPCTSSDDDDRIVNFIRRGPPPWNGRNPFPGLSPENTSTYWAGTLSTNIGYWAQSRINIHKLQVGNPEVGNIFTPKLKHYNLDSNFPYESDPYEAFLNQFNLRIYAFSSADKLIIILVLFLKLSPLLFGVSGGLIGLLTGAIAATLFTLLFDQKDVADWVLGFRECRADSRGGLGEGRLKGLHPPCRLYNSDFSQQNVFNEWFAITDKYNTCECLGEMVNGLKWSNPQSITGIQDSFRKFKPNNRLILATDTGMVQQLIKWGSQVWLHDESSFQNTRLGDVTVDVNNGETLRLGSGTAFGPPYKIGGDTNEGYGGVSDPDAGIVTNNGYISIDDKANAISVFNGQWRQLNYDGFYSFLMENVKVQLRALYPELKGVSVGDDLGYTMGMDHRRRRLVISKRDYYPVDPNAWEVRMGQLWNTEKKYWADYSNTNDFKNLTWTLAYRFAGERSGFIGFYSFSPEQYLFDRDSLFAFEGGTLWHHDTEAQTYLNFYGKQYPFILDINMALMDKKGHLPFALEAMRLKIQAMQHLGKLKLKKKKDFMFTHIWIKNSKQSSGLQNIHIDKIDKQNYDGRITAYKDQNVWKLSNWKNLIPSELEDVEFEMLDNDNVAIQTKPNPGISKIKVSEQDKRFIDDYAMVRFIYDGVEVRENMIFEYLEWYYDVELLTKER